MEIKKLTFKAEECFRKGDLIFTEKLVYEILKEHPNDTNANELLAYVKAQKGDYINAHKLLLVACSDPNCTKEALYYLGKSYLMNKNNEQAIINIQLSISKGLKIFESYNDLGIAFAENNNYEEALVNFNNALLLNCNSYNLFYNIAKCFDKKGSIDKSIEFCKYALKINSIFSEARLLLGISFSKKFEFKEAILCFESILKLHPNYSKAWTEIGLTLIEMNQLQSAILNLNKAIEIDSTDTTPLLAKGIALQKLYMHEEAINTFDDALHINPLLTEAFVNKGVSLNAISNFDEARYCFESAIKIDAYFDIAWSNLGITCNCLKKYDEAILCFTKAININENNKEAHYGLSYSYFQQNNFNNAWKEFEFRWETPKMIKQKFVTKKPEWKGICDNQRLYLRPEQGLGEQILFSSVFNELQNSSVKLLASTNNKLLTVFKRSFPKINFIEISNDDLQEFDEYTAFGSAIRYFRKSAKDFTKCKFPYLFVNPDNISKFKQDYAKSNILSVGVSWNSYNKEIGSYKSIPNFHIEKLITEFSDFNWINLQNSQVHSNNSSLYSSNLRTINEFDTFNDIDSLISLIYTCDLIITCSNTTAHLAGALNKKTLLLLPYANGKLWYWQNNGVNSLWYPSIRLINQNNPLDWLSPINELKYYLKTLI